MNLNSVISVKTGTADPFSLFGLAGVGFEVQCDKRPSRPPAEAATVRAAAGRRATSRPWSEDGSASTSRDEIRSRYACAPAARSDSVEGRSVRIIQVSDRFSPQMTIIVPRSRFDEYLNAVPRPMKDPPRPETGLRAGIRIPPSMRNTVSMRRRMYGRQRNDRIYSHRLGLLSPRSVIAIARIAGGMATDKRLAARPPGLSTCPACWRAWRPAPPGWRIPDRPRSRR